MLLLLLHYYFWTLTASCKMVTGSFPVVKCGRGVLLSTHNLLVPRSWKSRAIPLPTLWATHRACKGITLNFFTFLLLNTQYRNNQTWQRDRFFSKRFCCHLSALFHQRSIILFRSYTLYVLANDGVVKQPTSVAVVCSSLSCRRCATFADLRSVFAVASGGVRGLNMAPCVYLSWCISATARLQSVVYCTLWYWYLEQKWNRGVRVKWAGFISLMTTVLQSLLWKIRRP